MMAPGLFFFGSILLYVTDAQLRIVAPGSLANQFPETKGVVYGTTATFGAPYGGEPLLARLVYAPSYGKDYCTEDDYSLPKVGDGKHDGTSPVTAEPGSEWPELVNVVLVRRGHCTFVTKVRVAEKKKARAVIVVDYENSTMTSHDIQYVVMADDGQGSSVKIPSLLISKFDGQKLIESVEAGEVIIELAWDIPRTDHVVVDFWMSSGSQEASEFLQRFKDTAETLKYHLQFEPHYHIFSLPQGSKPGHLCMDGGTEFCAPDPDGAGPITGEDVAYEDLRQLCIWRLTARADVDSANSAGYSQYFWDYVVSFGKKCPSRGGKGDAILGETCSNRIMAEVGLSHDDVQTCARDNRTKFLREQIRYVAWSPLALRINGWRYSGPLDPETVLKAVCSGYAKPPQECTELLSGFAALHRTSSSNGGIAFGTFICTTLAMMGCMVCSALLYRQRKTMSVRTVLREEVMLEVQMQMADYTEMQEFGHEQPGQKPSLSF
mmetsp:Transcript_11776/g.22532  ORF Transcript_11776/g.22532 Transcript_11776/m.22532 type:complete len:492 (-) Transcript_11776:10-1485(-)